MTAQKQILLSLFFFLLPAAASAATISLRATPTRIGAGDLVRVSVLLDSAVPTNAFSGALSYPGTMLEPIAISDGSSIISLWVVRPAVSAAGAPIAFAGITPGGFSGEAGSLFSVLFRAKAAGTAAISLGDIEVLRNDGAGEKEPVVLRPLALSVGPKPVGGYAEPVDHTPPESFTAYLGDDPHLFGDRNYLVFMAVDKGSGIDHYAVAETRTPSLLLPFFPLSWNETATSSYVIADQDLTDTVYIKAVDRAGNERVTIFPPQHLFSAYEKFAFMGILVLVALLWRTGQGRRFAKNP